ncbi:ATG4 [Candida jiufengensis]|uniref:ATG4 n=1 Tax=Candida jiufengensis TaxID=497108 RepID=UPI0022244B50|nr:ATG4 [Candida jiufengensis]KAI5951151.1 ATG4 [Candida jiufengensis]
MDSSTSNTTDNEDIVNIQTPIQQDTMKTSNDSTNIIQESQENNEEVQPQQENMESIIGRNMGKFSTFLRDVTGLSLDTSNNEEANSSSNSLSPSTVSTTQDSIVNIEEQLTSPIVVLGQEFTTHSKADDHIQSNLLWLSYRCGFEPIPKSENGPQPIQFFPSIIFNKSILTNLNSLKFLFDKDNFTSDSGWGCMIRTSQNLLANALLKLNDVTESNENELQILDLFQDNLNSLYSIHNFIRVSSNSSLQIKPGQWFGPNAASFSIKKLTDEIIENKDKLLLLESSQIKIPYVYISENCDLYDDEINEIFIKQQNSILLLFPVRLGIDQINHYYYNSLLNLLNAKYSVGIAGGKPSSSFYFFGYENENELIYFDPHLPQIIETPINIKSYHSTSYNKLNIKFLDPSMMIGILINSMDDYKKFKKQCIDSNSKIIHFHPNVINENLSSINQSWEEVNEEDDFVNLNVSKNEEEFIDLGTK